MMTMTVCLFVRLFVSSRMKLASDSDKPRAHEVCTFERIDDEVVLIMSWHRIRFVDSCVYACLFVCFFVCL